MANLLVSCFLMSATALILISVTVPFSAQASGDHHQHLGWIPPIIRSSSCKGSMAECLGSGEQELEMESEISRRILATSNYISYGALQRNTVPCSQRGASYYNCRPGAQANPYSRGCSTITRCRS